MAKSKIHQVVLFKDTDPLFEGAGMLFTKKETKDAVVLPFESYEYLGSPDEITVHVFPGDVSHHFPIPKS